MYVLIDGEREYRISIKNTIVNAKICEIKLKSANKCSKQTIRGPNVQSRMVTSREYKC